MAENSRLDDILFHMLILIPVEFGLLHATLLGPMISGFFEYIFDGLGFEFAHHAHGIGEAAEHAHEAAELMHPEP